MGLGTKQFSGDQGVDLGQTLLQTGAVAVEESKPPATRRQQQPQSEALKCPRCASTNTKFCYYNNYNKSQPRHFCKSCKRHWTRGGTLRNVPVGGGRKNKRPKISKSNDDYATTSTTTTTTTVEQNCDHRKTLMSSIDLHEALFRSYSPTTDTKTNTGLNGSDPNQNPNTVEFPFSTIDHVNPNLMVPTNYYNESLDSYDQYAGNIILDSLEESISSSITSSAVNNIPIPTTSIINVPSWPGPDWNWDEIDHVFTTSSDHLINIPWNIDEDHNDDDIAVIKP